uniref:SH2 domain-containing protein n=1 Tax=Cyprinodon variegatus TaxID=28743 RepID=A0A3Q2CHX9_CYPVA
MVHKYEKKDFFFLKEKSKNSMKILEAPEEVRTGQTRATAEGFRSLHFIAKQLILFQDGDVYNKPWFASTCDRKTADDALLRSNMDGAFLVRKSSGQDVQQPYTLVVFYNGRVYNIPIRFVPSTRQYALGREKKGEEVQLRLLKYLHLYV